jgi:hypothetical protein
VGGYGEVLGFEGAENIILDCILLVVPEGQQQKRGVLGNGKHVALTRSHLSGIWREGQDSQAFAAWDGPGPYTLTDNYLEAASENILFGGADASSPENIPADILIEGNHLFKRLAWKDGRFQIKNLAELKAAKRVRFVGNRLENCWSAADGQSGFAVQLTPRNQDGDAPFTVVEDVTIERNVLVNCERGINMTGYDNDQPSGRMTRITVRGNGIACQTYAFLLDKELGDVAIYRNTITTQAIALSFENLADSKMWKAGEAAPRHSAFSVERLTWAENDTPGYFHSHDIVGYPSTSRGDSVLNTYARSVSLTVPSDAPLPSVPPVQDGPPNPLPGTVVDAPSLPENENAETASLWAAVHSLHDQFDVMSEELADMDRERAATQLRLTQLLDYLDQTPNTKSVQGLTSYLRGAK